MKISSRKWIAISSCVLSTSGLIGGTIFSCVAPGAFNSNQEGFFVMTGLLLKSAAFICLVCKYIWVFTQLISDNDCKIKDKNRTVPLKQNEIKN